jgi:hypothetical protein
MHRLPLIRVNKTMKFVAKLAVGEGAGIFQPGARCLEIRAGGYNYEEQR